MRAHVVVCLLFVGTALAGCLSFQDDAPPQPDADLTEGKDDAVVIAVVDSGFNPYLWDFVGAKMPQHLNDDPLDDLPLDQDPATWLPGHPGAEAFTSYTTLNLTFNTTDPEARIIKACQGDILPLVSLTVTCGDDGLYEQDAEEWEKVERSSADEVHMYHIPNNKVVGYVNFGGGNGFSTNSHGVGTSTVSVGNLHGTCPECLLVFVNGPSEVANEWVAKQDWIDAQTNSWGLSLVMRDRMYDGSDTELQREAIERGHTIFFSAGNGQANTFNVPNPTLFSSQEGPDWVITVGAISPNDGSSYSGHGKPADIASVGGSYPSGGGATVNSTSTFGGTSNATPVTAGIYGRALYQLRREMDGASRIQADGVISASKVDANLITANPTSPSVCGEAKPDCAVADGQVTVHELQSALFDAAQHTATGWVTGFGGVPIPYENSDMRFMAEGHGSFWGRLDPTAPWWEESERIVDILQGDTLVDEDPEEVAWFIADSYCRQKLHGTWDHGAFNDETSLPDSDVQNHPVRTWLTDECERTGKAVMDLVSLING